MGLWKDFWRVVDKWRDKKRDRNKSKIVWVDTQTQELTWTALKETERFLFTYIIKYYEYRDEYELETVPAVHQSVNSSSQKFYATNYKKYAEMLSKMAEFQNKKPDPIEEMRKEINN